MEVRLARKLGFCFGVERAIEAAERTLDRGGEISSLGEIIHNRQVVDKLARAGLKVIDDPEEASGTVLIRSHGEGPQVFERLRQRGVEVVDATCVLVKQAQKIVAELSAEGYRVVVIGQAEHPEVRAVCAYAPDVICVDRPEDLDRLPPPSAKLGIICQTTHSLEHFGRMVGLIVARGHKQVKVVNTLCNEVGRRQSAAVELAGEVEVMFVLGGRQSANTAELARLCAGRNVPTYHLEGWQDFKPEMAEGKKVAGVTAGASTPRWVVEEFVAKLREFSS
jgi:(E)-4-hydroxy-3-methyl-but-2-enyl pyrophosphate reductase